MKTPQTTPLAGCPTTNPSTPPKQSTVLFLTALRQSTRLKRIQRVIALAVLLLMTIQTFAASYSVTLEGNGAFNPVALQLDLPGGNTLQNMFPSVPDNTIVLFWDCATEDYGAVVPTYSSATGTWSPNPTLTVGQGFFILNQGSTMTVTITGNPILPLLPPPMPCGCDHSYFLGNQSPTVATWESVMGAAPVNGSIFYKWDVNIQDSVINTFSGCAWSGGTPSLAVGEAARFYVPCSGTPCVGVPAFSLSGVYPPTVPNCGSSTIRIVGFGIQSGATVVLKRLLHTPIIASSATLLASGAMMDAVVSLGGVAPGTWDVEVTNPGGSPLTLTLPGAITVSGTPTLVSSSPKIVGNCSATTVTGYGSGFCSGGTMQLVKSGHTAILGTGVSVGTYSDQVSGVFDMTLAAPGAWDLIVNNPGGGTTTLVGAVTKAAPSFSSISPNSGGSCSTISITANTKGMCSVSSFRLLNSSHAPRVGGGLVMNADGTATATFTMSGMAAGSVWDAEIVSSSGTHLILGAFQIRTFFSVASKKAGNCGSATLKINGQGICAGASMRLLRTGQLPIPGISPVVNAAQTELSATFNLTSALLGAWDLEVTDASGAILTFPAYVIIAPVAATVVTPNQAGNCGNATVNIGGTGLWNASVKLARLLHSDIPGIVNLRNGDGLGMEASFNLSGAAAGVWDVVVTDPICGSVTLPSAFTVQPVAISLIQPVCGKVCQSSTIQIQGSCFAAGATVTLRQGASSITTASTVVNSGLINATFTPTATGVWDVEVVNPGGATATLVGKYTVLACTGCDVDVTMGLQSRVGVGRQAVGYITYKNDGLTTLSGVVVSVTDIPADATITLITSSPVGTINSPGGGSPQSITFTVPTLLAGQSANFYFYVTFPSIRPPVQLTGNVTSPCNNTHIAQIEVVASHDPNDKLGLEGSGEYHHILGTETLPYEILFENKASASAPAQEVFITDQLDPSKLDLSTFSLGTVRFGTHTVVAPPGLNSWTTYVPYAVNAVPSDDILVKIICALVTNPIDPNYGKLTWSLLSIDPITGLLPTDPLRGFLPPNTTSPNGEGKVTYSVKAKNSLVTDDVFGNNASIVFDLNPQILTPAWINIIDKTAPASSVTALPALQATTSFAVDWSGSDAGSGIASYDVFVSDNNGPFTAWLSGTTATTGTFNGVGGHTYRFYSVAKDGVGHVETSPVSPDATTMVRPWLSLTRSGNNIIVAWEGAGGTLQEAGEVNGIWSDILGATSPYVSPMYPTNHFYRLRP